MTTQTQEVDTTFYETLPPQMVDLRRLPPMQSDSLEVGRSQISAEEARDPLYPFESMQHDTDEGYKRWQEMKEKKKNEVAGYLLVRSKYWEQVRAWRYFPDKQTETWKYFSGSTESKSKEVDSSIEAELGLTKGIFSAKVKGALKFSTKDTTTFTQSTEHTVELTYEADCYYLFWQIVESVDLFRLPKTSPSQPAYVKSYTGYTEYQMANKFRKSDLTKSGGAAMPPFMAAAKILKKGESTAVGTYLIGKTKFCFKNLSDQETSEVTLVPTVGGLWREPWVITINPGYTKTVRHAYTADRVTITNSGAHDVEVWTG